MSPAMEPNEKAAHQYADAGWRVLPIIPGEKVPATARGFQDASTNHKQVQKWFRDFPARNVGIATGRPGPDVLDVDVTDGKPGPRSLNQAVRAHLVPSPMATVRTASGGEHLYYPGSEQGNGSLPKHGLDWRSKGGYVLAPPSSIGGRPYELTSHGREPRPIDFERIREHFEPQADRPAPTPAREGQDLTHLVRHVASLPDGHGRGANGRTFWSLCRALEAGDAATADAIEAAAIERGLTARAVRATRRSAERTVSQKAVRSLGPKKDLGREAG